MNSVTNQFAKKDSIFYYQQKLLKFKQQRDNLNQGIEQITFENRQLRDQVTRLEQQFDHRKKRQRRDDYDIILELKKELELKQEEINNLKLDHTIENTKLKIELGVVKEKLESNVVFIEKLKEENMLESENSKALESILFHEKSNRIESKSKTRFSHMSLQTTIQSQTRNIWALSNFQKLGKNYLTTGSWDKSVKILNFGDANNATLSASLDTSIQIISTTTFQLDDCLFFLACGGWGCNAIEVWNLQNNLLEYSLTGHSKRIVALSNFQKNGTFLVSGSMDKTIKLWDITTNPKNRYNHPNPK